MSRRFQFSVRASLVAMLVIGLCCWLNRDAPVFAAVGAVGALLCLVGDCSLRLAREAGGMRFVGSVSAGAVSLGLGAWFLAVSVLTSLRHVIVD